jgi:hypothetical protein
LEDCRTSWNLPTIDLDLKYDQKETAYFALYYVPSIKKNVRSHFQQDLHSFVIIQVQNAMYTIGFTTEASILVKDKRKKMNEYEV